TVRIGPADELPTDHAPSGWDAFCAGSFEEDVARVTAARALAQQPRVIGAVAAGVRDFGREVTSAEGVYGIAQWFPGGRTTIELGPTEEDFLQAYSALTGAVPDYPAVQAAATAVLATHCARTAGTVARESLWPTAAALQTTTMFGAFRIDPASGAQLGHQTALVRWTANGPRVMS
ncbi:MAG: ABC transporter substrate-binding protein, partial [Pseudonocardiaceae bacterium]